MAVAQATLDALDLGKLTFPKAIPVVRLDVEDYTDAEGDPALRILAVIDEFTDLEKVSGDDVADMKDAIYESLRRHGIELFPYIFIAKPSELVETDEDGD